MNTLAVAVLFVAVAYSSASVVAPAVVSRGALEGALGGQWVPDVPVAAHGYAAHGYAAHGYAAAAPIVAARAGWAGPAAVVAPGWTGAVSAKGAIEGALGGQWIPDVPVAHAAPVVSAYAAHAAPVVSAYAAPAYAAHSVYAAGPAIAGWHGVDARGALEGALGGQWIPDVAH